MTEPTSAPGAWQGRRQPAAGEAAAPAPTPARRLGFRLLFSYLLLYDLELALRRLPGTGLLLALWQGAWRAVVPWVGRVVTSKSV